MDIKHGAWVVGLFIFQVFGMDKPVSLKPQESPAIQIISSRTRPSCVPTLACLAARCMGQNAQLLQEENVELIAPSDLVCVKEVMLREFIKPHIFPLAITKSENNESVHHNGVCGLDAITSTHEVVSGACDGKVVFCNKNSLAAGTGYITGIHISALSVFEGDEVQIFLGSQGGMIYRMGYKTKNIDLDYRAHEITINKLCVGNSLIASCSNDKTVKIWEKETGKSRGILGNFEQAVRCIEWLEGEKILVSGSSEGKIKLWNTACQKLVKEFQYFDCPRIWGMDTMKKKKHIIAGFNNGRISLVDGTILQEIAQWYGHGTTISALSCDADEKYFATASWDCKARLWDVRMRACAATFIGHSHWLQQVKCAGNEVITGSRDYMLRLWDIRKLKALEVLPLPTIALWGSRLKNVPRLKEPHERDFLLDELTKTP